MEIRLDIGLNEFISLIKQLPMQKQILLKNELEKEIANPRIVDGELTTILLNGPVMSKSDYEDYKLTHNYIGEWTKKLFV